ncbi:MAG: 3'-5' exonuclease, partial [Saprospiraceae bacterium]|nr:3'-5' exonuclease [Saprospiraceae bacterium]
MFAVIDIETTGGSPRTGRIIEVAIVVHNGKRVIEEYSSLVNPETPIDSFVAALT